MNRLSHLIVKKSHYWFPINNYWLVLIATTSGLVQWPFQVPIYWRYLSCFLGLGLNFRGYAEVIWLYIYILYNYIYMVLSSIIGS